MNKEDIVFESDRLYFIKINKKLVNDFLIMVNDIEVQKFISHEIREYTYEQEIEWINSKLNEGAYVFSMIEKSTLEFVGNIEIMNIKERVGEIGISITHLKQNKHYGTEAMKKIIDYALNVLKLKNIDLNVYKTNLRAIHCYEKVGFIAYGVGRSEEEIHMIYNISDN